LTKYRQSSINLKHALGCSYWHDVRQHIPFKMIHLNWGLNYHQLLTTYFSEMSQFSCQVYQCGLYLRRRSSYKHETLTM